MGVAGITYNFLDKPELINITGKGTIQIIYDADGNKLQKKYTPSGSSTTNTTTYINEFVYQGTSVSGSTPNETLSYINFEEGRIRAVTAVSSGNGFDGLTIDGNIDLPSLNLPSGGRGAFDYFIRDYQQNVRMILTEETHTGVNQCTMESSRATNEEPVFGQATNNEVVQTRFAISGIPGQTTGGGWHSNISSSVSNLGSLTHKMGPNVLLKVMAGDQINATAQYYYQNPVTNNTGNNLTTSIVTALIQSILGSPGTTGLTKGNTANISTQLNADPNLISKTAPDANNAGGTNPKAYLTIVFFDERFNYVAENSTAVRVSQQGDGARPLVLPANIKAPKNGFAYIYLSNESSEPVYFDNFTVSDNRGRIIEEDHYYAFGLKIAGISSKKLPDPNEGTIDNKNLYNDKELFDDADLDWYDYGFRNYDPQMGRFPQLDPLTDDYSELTPYQYASDEPIANVDMDGLEKLSTVVDFTYSYAHTATPFVYPTLSKVAAPVATGVAKLSARVAIPLFNTTLNAMNRSVQDNVYIKNPIRNTQLTPSQAPKLKKAREKIPYVIPTNQQNIMMFHEGSTLLKDIRTNSTIIKYRILQGATIVEGSGLILLGGAEATPLLLETATDQSLELYYNLERSFNLLSEDFFLALRWHLRRVLSVDNLIRLEKLADKQRDVKKLYDELKKIKELLDKLSKLKR